MDKLQKSHGFSGRSELVRAGIRNLLSEERKRQDLNGILHALFLAVHDEDSDEEDKLISTHLHSKIDRDRCLEIFLIRGDAHEVKEMTNKFQANKNMDNVQLIVM
jgi:CopG family nickel-responsive transcriptional regulator